MAASELSRDEFTRLCDVPVPFGKHKGKTLARMAGSDTGLLYLDKLLDKEWVTDAFKAEVKAFLGHPSISRQLDNLLGI